MNRVEGGRESAFRRVGQAVASSGRGRGGRDSLGFKSDNIHLLIHVSF